jgi:hypothetical protein
LFHKIAIRITLLAIRFERQYVFNTQDAPANEEKIPGSVKTVCVDRVQMYFQIEERIAIAQKN